MCVCVFVCARLVSHMYWSLSVVEQQTHIFKESIKMNVRTLFSANKEDLVYTYRIT